MNVNRFFFKTNSDTIDRPLVWLVVGGLAVLLCFGLYGLLFRVDRQALVQVSGTLADAPAVQKTWGRNPSKYLWVPIREWRGLIFDLNGAAFDATYADAFVQAANAGDSVRLWVDPHDYRAKIARETAVGLWEDLLGSAAQVQVYQVSLKGRDYLTVDNYERLRRASHLTNWLILGLLWVFLVVCRVNGWLPRKP